MPFVLANAWWWRRVDFSVKEYLFLFLKGAAMGAANVIPGVSGGTIAFITGIYERMIGALRNFDMEALQLVLRFRISALSRHIDLGFLIALALGTLASILSLAKVLEIAFERSPTLVWAFFFGLILASIYFVGRMVGRWRSAQLAALLVGTVGAAALALMTPSSENSGSGYLIICGVVAICSTIIPGLSGSFVLLLMGNYKLIMIESVNALREMNFSTALPVLLPVGLGAILGVLALSRFLNWLFKNFHDTAVALITGFVAGSLVTIWPWKVPQFLSGENGEPLIRKGEKVVAGYDWTLPDWGAPSTWVAVGLMVVGGVAVAAIEWFGRAPQGDAVKDV